MVEPRILFSGLWVSLMLTYLLGDVLRIFAGDFEPGKIGDIEATQLIWLAATLFMLIPIVMIVLTMTVGYPTIRWLTMAAALVLFLLNVVGLPTYPGLYDKFLIVVGLILNVVTVWYAWNWVQ